MVKHGGREEYDAIVKIHDKPKTPQEKIAAMSVVSYSMKKGAWLTDILQRCNGSYGKFGIGQRDVKFH